MRRFADIPCSREHTDRRLIDIYVPDGDLNGAAVFLIHGGGFRVGDKTQWGEVFNFFCDRGYVCGATEYRLSPEWKFPAWLEDVRLAMAARMIRRSLKMGVSLT